MNPCASLPTYSLSRGAPSPLGYISIACIHLYRSFWDGSFYRTLCPSGQNRFGGEGGIRTHGSDESLVFKTSSLNPSDTSPNRKPRPNRGQGVPIIIAQFLWPVKAPAAKKGKKLQNPKTPFFAAGVRLYPPPAPFTPFRKPPSSRLQRSAPMRRPS